MVHGDMCGWGMGSMDSSQCAMLRLCNAENILVLRGWNKKPVAEEWEEKMYEFPRVAVTDGNELCSLKQRKWIISAFEESNVRKITWSLKALGKLFLAGSQLLVVCGNPRSSLARGSIAPNSCPVVLSYKQQGETRLHFPYSAQKPPLLNTHVHHSQVPSTPR